MSSMVVQFDPALTLAKSRKFSFQSWFAGLTDLEKNLAPLLMGEIWAFA